MAELGGPATSHCTAATQATAPWGEETAVPLGTAPAWPKQWDLPTGIVTRQWLREAERLGIITSDFRIPEDSFQPASLDLLLGPTAYRIRASFLPGAGTVKERLNDVKLDRGVDIRSGYILEPGRPYLVPLREGLRLPENVRAYANPKSSTGRVDVFTRVMTDKSFRFDHISAGYEGRLWLEVYSQSFPVRVREGMALNQIRLIVEATPKTGTLGGIEGERRTIPDSAPDVLRIQLRSSIQEGDVTASPQGAPVPIGFKAKRQSISVLDLDRHDHDPREFWEPIWATGRLVLDPEGFYLLRSRERIIVPPHLAAEMVAFDPAGGEMRAHYAGFFDPGFGSGVTPGGLPAVLEVRARDVPFMLEDGQEVAKLRYYRLVDSPDRLYGREAGSHYAGAQQWRFLSKHFRPWSQLPLRF